MEALSLWRWFPTQIESGLALYTRRHIREWHSRAFTLSSRELLGLLAEFPDSSTFKQASERTFRLVEYTGPGEHRGKLFRTPLAEIVPPDVTVIAEYADWTHDRKVLARNARELASLRADGHDYLPDLTGLVEPLEAILSDREQAAKQKLRDQLRDHVQAGLYGYEKR